MFFATILLSLTAFLTSTVSAANISISASVDKNITALGEPVQLQVVVSGDVRNIPQPQLPELNDFNIQSSGRSQNISIVNGRVSSSVSFNYSLLPKKTGKFKIGPFTVSYAGHTFSSSPIEIEVRAQKLPQTKSPSAESVKSVPDAFIETVTDKRSAYIGQQINLTFRFYTSVNVLSQPQYIPPSLTGFVSEDLPPQKNYRTTIAGKEYHVTELKTALFPVSKGNLTIGPAVLRCTIEDLSGHPHDFFFRNFFSSGKQVELKSKPIVISVKDLPQSGKPANFSGAVGNYTISASIDKTKLETGQAATLTVKVAGTGNIKSVLQPKIVTPNFRQYETISSVNISKDGQKVGGSKEFKTVIIPAKPGKLIIPAISLSFFEPESASYKTVFTKPISVEVQPGKLTNILPTSNEEPTQPLKYVAEDIRHIKQTFTSAPKLKITYSWLFFQLLPFCFFMIIMRIDRAQKKMFGDKKLLRKTYAYKIAVKSLKKIKKEKVSQNGDASGILELAKILKNYIADKRNISKYGITNEQILEALKSVNTEENLFSAVEKFLTKSDYLRYAPVQKSKDDLQLDIKEVREIIERLERILK